MNTYNSLENNAIEFHPKYGYITRHKLKIKLLKKDINHTHLCVLASLLLSFTLSFMLSFILSMAAPTAIMWGIPSYLYYSINMFGSALTIGLPFAVYLAFKNEPVTEHLKFRKNGKFESALFIFAAVALCLLANFPSILISELVEGAGMNGEAVGMESGSNAIESLLYFVTVAVFPPIFEEFAFRGVMLSSLRKHGDGVALVVSTIAFAMMHSSISSMPFALVCGFAMGYVYLRTENLWLSIIIHFINNANATLPGILYLYMPEMTVNIISNIIFYGLILIGLIALIVLIIRSKIYYRAEHVRRCISFDLPIRSKIGAYLTSLGAVSVLIVTAALIVMTMLGLA